MYTLIRNNILRLIFLFLTLASVSLLSAQNYVLKGRVRNEKTQEALTGASVNLLDLEKGTNTRADGSFSISRISSQRVRVRVNFIGFKPFEFTHDFLLDPNPDLNIYLIPEDMQMDAVDITGRAEGQLRAFLQQKRAINIKNIISAEQIQTFPDLNAAEAIQRVPGITLQRDQGEGRYIQLRGTAPELATFNINGEQVPSPEGDFRFVGLDIIAADQIESIEVTKVLTPDMDADGVAGNVNIVTKTATTEEPDVRAVLTGGYNNLRQTPNYQAQFSFGERYKKFGFHINSSYFVNNFGSESMEFSYIKGPFFNSQNLGVDNYQVHFEDLQIRHYNITRTRLGISPSFDYEFNENHMIYLRGIYNRFTDNELRRRKVFGFEDPIDKHLYLFGDVEHDMRQREKIQELATVNLGGEHSFGRIELDYMVQLARASENIPDQQEIYFESPGQATQLGIDTSEERWLRVTYPLRQDSINAFSFDRYEMDEYIRENDRVIDNNFAARLNLKIPYNFGLKHKGYFKFGGKYRFKRKTRDIDSDVFGAYRTTSRSYAKEGDPLNLLTVSDGFRDDNVLNQGYVIEAMPAPELVDAFYLANREFFIYDQSETRFKTFSEDYLALEDIYAAYGMIRHDWGRLMIVGGLRFELTEVAYTGRNVKASRGRFVSFDTLMDARDHPFFLPQVQLRYKLDKQTNLRAAYTETYQRPNFRDVLPYREKDRDKVTYGNPDLIYPRSTNVDLLAERYIRDGILSGGVFYKHIDNFIFYYTRHAHECAPGDCGLDEITKPINGDFANVYGAEVQAQFQFNFLSGKWSNFGVYANYTYTQSSAFINKRLPANISSAIVTFQNDDLSQFRDESQMEEVSLPGQANHAANFSILYNGNRLFARISANYQDDFLYQLGVDEDVDEYYGEALRLDFTANYQITPQLKVFVDAINLTNTPLYYYLTTPSQALQQEYYSWWGRLGIKLSF